MVIQRIQTLYLLIAIAMLATFFFVPYGYVDAAADGAGAVQAGVTAVSAMELLVPLALTIVLLVVAIVLFKKPSLQKLIVVFAALLTLVVAITVVLNLVNGFNGVVYWGAGGLLLIPALVVELLAYRGIVADQRLLRSYDSFR